jgi:hypothetical protein
MAEGRTQYSNSIHTIHMGSEKDEDVEDHLQEFKAKGK